MGEYLHKAYDVIPKVKFPKVSIIIPVYNVDRYLEKCLASVVKQTLEEIEIIIIDDNSPDDSKKIIKQFQQKDKRITLIEQKVNLGQGVARNCGLDISQGDFIMFLDSDDWLEREACEKAYKQILRNKNDFVFFDLYCRKEKFGFFYIKDNYHSSFKYLKSLKNNFNIDLSNISENWLTTSWCWSQIYSRDFLNANKIRFSEDRFTEDIPFFIKSVICAKSVSIIDEKLYNYRDKNNKTTIIDYTHFYKSVLSAKEKAWQIIDSLNCSNRFREKFLLYEIKSDITHFKNFACLNKSIRNKFFQELKLRFVQIKSAYSDSLLKQSQVYDDFELIVRCENYFQYKIKRFGKKILNILGGKSGRS